MPVADRSAMCWNRGDSSISESGLASAGAVQMQAMRATAKAAHLVMPKQRVVMRTSSGGMKSRTSEGVIGRRRGMAFLSGFLGTLDPAPDGVNWIRRAVRAAATSPP
jgi:hypothetical protein